MLASTWPPHRRPQHHDNSPFLTLWWFEWDQTRISAGIYVRVSQAIQFYGPHVNEEIRTRRTWTMRRSHRGRGRRAQSRREGLQRARACHPVAECLAGRCKDLNSIFSVQKEEEEGEEGREGEDEEAEE